jgi:[acyl-carrier-protein] S-malonyltransferase
MQEAAPAGVSAMAAVLGAEDQLGAGRLRRSGRQPVVVPANFNCRARS